jgi:hypothetical protein
MTEVRDERNAHEYALPERVAFWSKTCPPSVATNAQIKIATQAIGTMTLLTINSHLRLFGCMYRNGTCRIQKITKLIIVFVVMPCDSGIWFFSVRKDGQIAPSITRTVLAPFMVWMANQKMARMAREMMAM